MQAPSPSALFQLRVDAPGTPDLEVVRFRGIERLSRCFSFDVTTRLDAGAIDETTLAAALMERTASLRVPTSATEARAVTGVVTRVSVEGVDGDGRAVVRVRVEPRLALLGEGRQSRIFQEQPLSGVLGAVLTEAGLPHRFSLAAPRPPRVYCVQHQESDLAFIARLCAEDGVFFWFEPPEGGDPAAPEVIVFADSPEAYAQIAGDPTLAYRQATGAAALAPEERHVTRFARRQAKAPRGARVKGFDFARPALDLGATRGEAIRARTTYEHHDHDERIDAGAERAQTVLEQARARADLGEGASWCRRLAPGHRFSLEGHDVAALNGRYVLTRVEHDGHNAHLSGSDGPSYEARFRCAPEAVPVRPPAPRASVRQALETATVVGPPGEEIHTDALGRVKVQFHWDLDGARDDRSSCWLRVATPWAGAGWGFQFVPRVGMEVLVGFLGGDLDRPVVVGALHNGLHAPTHPLPRSRSRSGIRTQSTPGGGGYNEIAFEDRAGGEQVVIRAQRDLDASIENDATETVGRDKTLNVAGKQVIRVEGDRDDHVTGALVEVVEGGASRSCGGDARGRTTGSVAEEILQNRSVEVHGTDTAMLHGGSTTVVGGPHVLRVDAEHTLLVGEGRDDGQAEVSVSRKYLLSSGSVIRVRAEDSIVLESGQSSIEVTPKGVVIRARSIEIVGSERASLSGPGPAVRLASDAEIVSKVVKIYGEEASIELGKKASVKGEQVLLNCDEGAPEPPEDGEAPPGTKRFSIRLTDERFEPYAGKRFKMVCEGLKLDGETGGDGSIEADVPEAARTAEITLWLGEFPTGQVRRYSVRIEDLPAPTSIAGAQIRLKNLGYYRGAGKGEIDDETRASLRRFQSDHALEPTGELDGATAGSIVERHGS